MTVALLGIGTELSRGDLTNSNGSWLARELTQLGYEVAAIDVVDDDPGRIEASLSRLALQHELVICTGGLGPTTDDITTACAARVIPAELELHEPSVQAIVERLKRFGRTLSESNKKQAYFPKGADILPNDWGTAPGFSIHIANSKLYFLPGVPTEMMELFRNRVIPSLSLPKERTPVEVLLCTYGLPEATLNDRLEGIEALYAVTIGYRVKFPEIEVKVHARDGDHTRAVERAEMAARAIIDRLGPIVYGRGNVTMAEALGQQLANLRLSVATAESCTGGLLSSLLTETPGASNWFCGGVVAYSNQVKTDLLGVGPDELKSCGAVSVEIARAMAIGACHALKAPVGVGITGIAGPDGGSEQKPVGTVCFGIHGPFGTKSAIHVFAGSRQRIQRVAAFHAMSMLLGAISS